MLCIRPMKTRDVERLSRAYAQDKDDLAPACDLSDPMVLARFAHLFDLVEEGGQLVGSLSFYEDPIGPSIGFWIAPEARGRGLATRALRLFFRTRAVRPRLCAQCWADNMASIAVLRKVGFTQIARGTMPCGRETLTFERLFSARACASVSIVAAPVEASA